MTAVEAPALPTATGPTARSTVRTLRGPVLVGVLLAVALAVTAVVSRGGPDGRLEPGSYSPAGARALAELLEDRGVPVRRVDTVDAALEGTARTVLLLPAPSALTAGELARLSARPGELVVVEAQADEVEALGAPVEVGGRVPVEPRRPACDLPAAQQAGDAELGGPTYRARGADAVGCYASGGRPTLLRVAGDRLTLLGDGDLLTNDRLDDRGNAALALGLLAGADEVRWLVPAPGRDVADGGQTPLAELVPDWVGVGALQLLLAAAVLALWRARRLGRVVTEPLPVVVRSAEAVEGRARLYRAAGARGRAAQSLRAAARARLVRRLGLSGEAGLVEAVADRTGRDAGSVADVLFGGPPPDDAALVRLADALDALARDAAAAAAEGGSSA